MGFNLIVPSANSVIFPIREHPTEKHLQRFYLPEIIGIRILALLFFVHLIIVQAKSQNKVEVANKLVVSKLEVKFLDSLLQKQRSEFTCDNKRSAFLYGVLLATRFKQKMTFSVSACCLGLPKVSLPFRSSSR